MEKIYGEAQAMNNNTTIKRYWRNGDYIEMDNEGHELRLSFGTEFNNGNSQLYTVRLRPKELVLLLEMLKERVSTI